METKTIFPELLAEIDSMDSRMFSPPHELEKGETVLMTIEDEDIKKLYNAMTHYKREHSRCMADLRFEPDREDLNEHHQRLDSKSDLMKEMWWYAVRMRYNIWVGNLGIRKGWKLVTIPDSDHPKEKIKRLLNELGGAGGILEL